MNFEDNPEIYQARDNKTPWIWYRLGDMAKNKKHRDQAIGRKLHYKLYPDSIASEYMRQTDKDWDIDVLINLIKKFPPDLTPDEDELTIHLRVGNVIDHTRNTVKELLEKSRPYWPKGRAALPPPEGAGSGRQKLCYVKPLSFYKKHLGQINKQVKKITLVAGGNLCNNYTKSREYIQVIKNLFKESGFDVRVRLGNPPDDDFVYLCRSKFFIGSGGGFSQLVQRCRRKISAG